MVLLEPLDSQVQEYADAYLYCKLFGCSLAEYESRPFEETRWMMQIHQAYLAAERDVQEKAANQTK